MFLLTGKNLRFDNHIKICYNIYGDKMRTHYIYIIKNKINKKIYIGQTLNFDSRMREHKNSRKDTKSIIDNSIKKYGFENFEIKILNKAYNQEEADELERKYIKEYNSLLPNGYNVLIGGRKQQGSWNAKPILVYDLNGNFLKEYSSANELEAENPKYNATSIRDCCCKKTKRYKDIIIKYKNDNSIVEKYINTKNQDKKKAIVQYNIEGEKIKQFNSVTEASKELNIKRTLISSCLIGKSKTTCGYIFKYLNEKINIDKIKPKTKIMYLVKQLDQNKKIVNTFVNCKEAEIALNLRKGAYKNINRVLNNPKRKAYGFYWEVIK